MYLLVIGYERLDGEAVEYEERARKLRVRLEAVGHTSVIEREVDRTAVRPEEALLRWRTGARAQRMQERVHRCLHWCWNGIGLYHSCNCEDWTRKTTPTQHNLSDRGGAKSFNI